MGLVLKNVPGFSDLPDSVLVAGQPALAIHMGQISSNAAFGMVRTEFFQAVYGHGDTVPLPVSPIDGYNYSRDECLFHWDIKNSLNQQTHWITGPDSLWFAQWLVDQNTGLVTSIEWYRRSGHHANPQKSNDGFIMVTTIGQRRKSTLIATDIAYTSVDPTTIAIDKPLTQALAQGLNDNAKFSALNSEVFYLGEFVNGNTVPHPVSPADGYTYSYAECKFLHSWRWTTVGSSWQVPPGFNGQLGPMKASVSSVGVCTVSVDMINDAGGLDVHTDYGRIAVFAFCTRSATPATLPLANAFTELDPSFFFPGITLRASTVLDIKQNIDEAILTPEFFGPTDYANGDTVPLPVSPVDGYTYVRSELRYLWEWKDTTNQTGSNLRVPFFVSNINPTTGVVLLNVWRLPPGGPYVDDNNTLARIRVITVAIRQAQAAEALPADSSTSNAPTDAGTTTVDQTTLEVNSVSIAIEGNLNDTTPAAPSGDINAKWQVDDAGGNPANISAHVPSTGGVDAQTGTSYTVGTSDRGKLVTFSNGSAIAVTLPNTLAATFFFAAQNLGAGTATFTPSAGTINGAANLALVSGSSAWFFFDGTNWEATTVAASGSSGSSTSSTAALFGDGETPSGTINGSNTAFTLANAPNPSGSLLLYLNGQLLRPGASNDYTISGSSITMATAPATGDILLAWYRYSGTANFADDETPAGTINGSNTAFTLANTPSPAASLQLYLNGELLRAGAGNDYTLSGATITMASAPLTGDILLAWYRFAIATTATFADAETPSGTINGSNAAFSLAHAPTPAASLQLFLNGQLLRPGAGNDYTISVSSITMASAPLTGDILLAWYRY